VNETSPGRGRLPRISGGAFGIVRLAPMTPMAALLLLAIAIGVLAESSAPAPTEPPPADDGWLRAAPGHSWSFPRDHYAHPGHRTEWWYLTGHLRETDAPPDAEPVAFQFTLFRIGLDPEPAEPGGSAWRANALVMGHAAVTDPAAGRHVFSETLWRAAAGLGGFGAPGDTTLAWCLAPPGTPGRWSIALANEVFAVHARDDHRGLGFDLTCRADAAPVLQGPGGFSPKDATGTVGSLYYSLPRLTVTGTLRRGDREVAVTGQAWLDREIFTSTLGAAQTGWDWVSLQLDDGRNLMLYRLRTAAGRVDFALGSLIDPDGAVTALPAGAWSLEPLADWTSGATAATYPIDWRLRVPGAAIDVELRAVLADQENVSIRTGVHYWEGGVRAIVPPGAAGAGTLVGRGFVELTGYGAGSRPPV
jgi:predicted secreted hydrolase